MGHHLSHLGQRLHRKGEWLEPGEQLGEVATTPRGRLHEDPEAEDSGQAPGPEECG